MYKVQPSHSGSDCDAFEKFVPLLQQCPTPEQMFHCPLQMSDWIESHFLTEQVESIKELSDYVTNLTRVGPGLGEYTFDKETLGGEDS